MSDVFVNSETRLYGLIGHLVESSKSPAIHNKLFESENINGTYLAFDVERRSLEEAVKGLRVLGARGFNVTIPFKESVIDYLDDIDASASDIGAVNTVLIENGRLVGYNTDGRGFCAVLEDEGVDLADSKILLIGAGGAARGIAFALSEHDFNCLDIINRNEKRGSNLAKDLNDIRVEYIGNEVKDKSKYDLVINTTSIGMTPNEEVSPMIVDGFKSTAVFADIVYKPHETKFLKEAKCLGHKVVYGIDMLIYQALLSEEIWQKNIFDKKSLKYSIRDVI
ncbi:MAG: shikimate dehydrogenase [Tissierellales bacterium]|nr:shikimate dehydrogenase [Tissierellales bacterium]